MQIGHPGSVPYCAWTMALKWTPEGGSIIFGGQEEITAGDPMNNTGMRMIANQIV